MAVRFRAAQSTIVRIPWLAPLDERSASLGHSPRWVMQEVPEGTDVYVDEDLHRASFAFPDGQVTAWEKLAQIRVTDEPYWNVDWFSVEDGWDSTGIGFLNDEFEGDIRLSLENVEGKEDRLFPEFYRLISDPQMNPRGFMLPSGRYNSNHEIEFDIQFDPQPRMVVVPETVPIQPNFPYQTYIGVNVAFSAIHPQKGISQSIEPGLYYGEVTVFNSRTGEVPRLKFDGENGSFVISGSDLENRLIDGTIEIAKIRQDRRPNY